ncbi:MAG: cyclic nucleotide-binding domain-containing protein [Bdellovibrionota bacterium]
MVVPILKATSKNLREIKLLNKLSDAELETLIPLGSISTVEAHTNIVIEGELSWGLYLILEGIVGVYKTNKMSGELHDVGQLKSGSFFGEMSLVDENPRSATVRALLECQLFYLSRDVFMKFLDRSPDLKFRFYESCLQHLILRLRELGDNYVISQYQLWKTALSRDKKAG